MFQHACLKCKTKYEDADPDPYYCPPCNEVRKAIAAEIDAKPRDKTKVVSALQEFDAAEKVRGFVRVSL